MNETQHTPELRFDGFTEPWEQRKLGELVGFSRGQGLSWNDICDDGHYSCVLYGNLYTDYGAVISNIKYKTNVSPISMITSHQGDVLIPASDTTPTGLARAACILPSGVILGGDINILRPSKALNGCFLSFALNYYREELIKRIKGTTVRHLQGTDLKDVRLILPISSEEQVAIANVFQRLDALITLHQRKYERLQHLKQALLRKMFPKPGEQVPELRFNGFTEPWEERKLGELMDITSVRRVHQKDWCNSGVRFLRARDVVAYSKGEEVDDPLYISTAMYAEYSAQCGKVQKNDLLVTGVGTIGIPWLVPNDNPVYFKDGNIIWLKNRNALDGRFLYYDFMGAQIQTFIHETTGIGTVATFTIDTACKTPIIYPSQSEQHLIGSFFRDLDNLIALYRHKYERLKRLKQALLRKMFV